METGLKSKDAVGRFRPPILPPSANGHGGGHHGPNYSNSGWNERLIRIALILLALTGGALILAAYYPHSLSWRAVQDLFGWFANGLSSAIRSLLPR